MTEPVRRIVAWNTKVGRGDDALVTSVRNLIDDLNPDVLCLQECKGYTDALRDAFSGGWQVLCHRDWPEANSNPVMVRDKYGANKRGEPDGWNTLRTTKVWTGPQGGAHHGRTWTWVKVGGIFIMSFHRATGMTKGNKDAGREEADTVTNWINKRDDPVVVIGDHNIGPKKGKPFWSSKSIAQRVDGAVRFDEVNPGIDYAITRGVKPTKVIRKATYGSDHKAVLFVME